MVRQDGAAAPASGGATERGGPDLRGVFQAVVAVVLVGWAIRGLAPVLMPLTAAILIALAVMPVRDWVAAALPKRLSWVGVLAALFVVLLVLAAFVGVLVLAAREIAREVPVSAGQVVEMIQGGGGEAGTGGNAVTEGAEAGAAGEFEAGGQDPGPAVEGAAGPAVETSPEGAPSQGASGTRPSDGNAGAGLLSGSALETVRTLGQRALGAAGGAAAAALNSALAVLGGLVLVVFLTLLILGESGEWRKKVARALPWPDDWRLTESAEVIAQKMRAYLLLQAGLGAVSALLYALWLGFWGVGLLVVWPLLIFMLNFIPTIGSLVGGTLPVAYTLMTRDPGTAVAVGLGILAIEQVMGNLVQPRVQGRNVALSPLVVLVALVFWGWAWGIAGALLAVPVTIALVVLGAHVPLLRPWALMLSNRTEWVGLDEATRPS